MADSYPLSPAGEDRRAKILRLAQAEARRRRRLRHQARVTAVGVLLVVLSVMLTFRPAPPRTQQPVVILPAPPTRPVTVATTPPIVAPRPKPRQIVIQFIKTERNLARRLAIPAQRPTWRQLSDDELIEALADAGHPAGLAWVDGRELILYRPTKAGSETHPGKIAPFR